jgi:hypothetical protein
MDILRFLCAIPFFLLSFIFIGLSWVSVRIGDGFTDIAKWINGSEFI